MRDPMLDEEFLRELDQYPHKFLWAKIISLNMDEYPLEEITGKITSGSVNIDGTSVLRRTCSMTMVAEDVKITEFYWGLKTKFRFYIGVENWINPEYPDIIWFNEGMFMITSFNCTAGVNNYTINLQGKDKMTLLNGDLGGVIPASWDFATEDANVTDESGNTLYDSTGYAVIENNRIPIKDIILQAVHEFAQEPWQNIIVNDLDDYGIELLEYQGTTPLYYIIKQKDPASGDNSREVVNMTMDGDMTCSVRQDKWTSSGLVEGNTWQSGVKISELETIQFTDETSPAGPINASYEKLIERLDPDGAVIETKDYMRAHIKFENSNEVFTVAKITRDNGLQVCGYRITDIIYPYDLIASPGDTVTSILDKLVQMLGNFEYFYDVDGRFIFQKKRTYLDVSYNNIINEHSINSEVFANSGEYSSKYSYTFDDHVLVSSVQNAPNLSNLKNDYSLWGQRANGNITIPIHMRYAIDHKPMFYKTIGYTLQVVDTEEGKKKISFKGKISEDGEIKSLPQIAAIGDTYLKEDKYFTCTSQTRNDENEIVVSNFEEQEWNNIYSDVNKIFITEAGIEFFKNLKNNPDYQGENKFIELQSFNVVDWREIIYQMANDYRRHYRDNDFLLNVRNNNKYSKYDSFYEKGYTGYEKYYIDFEMNLSQGVVAYWRELYNPEEKNSSGRYIGEGRFQTLEEEFSEAFDENHTYTIKNKQGIEEVIYGYKAGDEVFLEINGQKRYWRSLKDKNTDAIVTYSYKKEENGNDIISGVKYSNKWVEKFSSFTYNSEGWNDNILNNPEVLNFWFDFIDTTGELNKYSVHNIGLRSKATNDDKIKAIYFRETPNVIFTVGNNKTEKNKWVKPGYCYINIPAGLNALFTISSRGKNAMDVIEDYLYSYTYPATAVTIATVPIYYLKPNTLIYINDKNTGIVGEYIAQKYSIQLGATAQMSINAVETAKRLY